MSAALILLWGCGTSDGLGAADKGGGAQAPLGCLDVPAEVRIGGSDVDEANRPIWVEMPEGSEQIMVHGPQGGWHIMASASVSHMATVENVGMIVTLDYAIRWPARDDAPLSFGHFQVALAPHDDDCGGYYAGMQGVLDVSALAEGEADTPPELLAGETLRLSMDAADREGRTAHDEIEILAALDPADRDTAE